ncbi:hypothetical protein FJU30_17350 [Affinibrenneria salicis]|uniref:Uncharacterized protein n=1 Tax=Affinibrenneria salicis TaxID=2590031 RepID=A0A5J5FX26_9GAMM|nr:hypothetical protein [Affinibrenneria salicis]KAA8998180.1 hypothetical protein FJU30_17350 [Affinibrenneria salicis]
MVNPWDFIFYRSQDNDYIIKVVSSEGIYKTDIERFFKINNLKEKNDITLNDLKKIAKEIRDSYPNQKYQEIPYAEVVEE